MDEKRSIPVINNDDIARVANSYELRELVKIGAFLSEMLTSNVPLTQKLKSRKLWVVIGGLLCGILTTIYGADSIVRLSSTILETVCVATYVFGEASVDRARAEQNTATINLLDTMTTAATAQAVTTTVTVTSGGESPTTPVATYTAEADGAAG